MQLSEKIRKYIYAGYPILYINGFNEHEIDTEIEKAVISSETIEKDNIWEWNETLGFVDFINKNSQQMGDDSLTGILWFIYSAKEDFEDTIVVLKDAVPYFEESKVIAALKTLSEKICMGDLRSTFIIVSPILKIPKELEPYITVLETDYLSTEQIKSVVLDFAEANFIKRKDIGKELLAEISIAFKGLSRFEIENILALSLADGGKIDRKDLRLIHEQKRQVVLKSGILEMIEVKESMDDIGGLENLKEWMRRKAYVLKNMEKAEEFGVNLPKGVLVAGMPGCGKSLNAKAAAHLFEIPLLRMDMGRLMGKYVGESEANMRKAIRMAESISPCVLWVDELEKAFSGIGGDESGVTTRLFGSFLTWMQEKENPVFVVATANDVSKLPPELLRKGRFDECFYVGFPDKREREKIFEIHIRKRRNEDLDNINIKELADCTDGYSGADIEGVVKESVEHVFFERKNKLRTEDILRVIKDTRSLKELMKESIESMEKIFEKGNFKKASK